MNPKVKYLISFCLIFITILATNCSAALFKWEAKELRKDNIDQKAGYKTVLMWRMKIIDRTKETKNYESTSSLTNCETKAYQ